MEKKIKPVRIAFLLFFLAAVLFIYVVSLYDLQIMQGAAYLDLSKNNNARTTTIAASRGSILDCNGTVLVSDRACYNVVISRSNLSNVDDPNDVILRLVRAARDLDYTYTDSLPVTTGIPFGFIDDMTDVQKGYIDEYTSFFANDLSPDVTATELMAFLREHYKIDPNYTAEEARIIAGVRFEIELRSIMTSLSTYVFVEDVSADLIAIIGEQDFPGISIVESTVREYHTQYAAHILGSIGLMNEEESKIYVGEQKYAYNALVGKSGIESAYESYLHGTSGQRRVTTDASGSVISTVSEDAAEPGQNVVLTLDIGLQATLENALASAVDQLEEVGGGGGVVVNVKTGGILAMASNPTYTPDSYYEDFAALSTDTGNPLTNRAITGLYQPGSTFKMVTALAALDTGLATEHTTFTCDGTYTIGEWHYKCLGTHGTVNLETAIAKSCNVYFYNLAERMSIETLAEYAEKLGLGSTTGLELPEAEGTIASRNYLEYLYEEGRVDDASWYTGYTLHAAIGQSYHQYTPLQLANYVAMLANNGVSYKTHLMGEIQDSATNETVAAFKPEVLNTLDTSSSYFSSIRNGMVTVAKSGTASATLGSLFSSLNIDIAAKTGTAQTGNEADDGVFVCYAPASDPVIAIAIVIEKGESGSYVSQVAKEILEYYFSAASSSQNATSENTLLP